jgi:hypothetical protein
LTEQVKGSITFLTRCIRLSPFHLVGRSLLFEAACKLNQATVHCVTSGTTPGAASAAKPKCVEKKLICEFFEAVLQILAKYHKATMPVTIIGQKSQAKTQGLKLWQNGPSSHYKSPCSPLA